MLTIVIEYEDHPDFSCEEPGGNYVALQTLLYDGDVYGIPVQSLSNSVFLADQDDWTTGSFYCVEDIPERCPHLREVAADLISQYNYEQAKLVEAQRDDEDEDEDERKLDAYGHLNWTVGNEDWMACFDAIRKGDKIAYHVVVNCESGGFIDTIEHGTVPATNEGIAELFALPSQYVDTCIDGYAGDPQNEEDYGPIEWEQCDREWREHLSRLLTLTSKEEDEEEDSSEEQSLDYFNRYIAGDR